ncbi:hypothetical protein DERP_009565 [Dermatophagoides pteronyssinus]|uniref:Uncharacterized protein n=1 Tax=Dermatophagoides pteronyssinus TaxID=6956 RepID=A0ABQ8JAT7_DERPT|nr:hypothetical protein DERP_009565 [Dermatophagoides pteronyssinus]
MATNRNFDRSLSKNSIEEIQQELLQNNDALRFHFWAMTIYQAYYSCYMQHHPNAYNERARIFEQMFTNNKNCYNNITFDQVRSYSARIARKCFPRTLLIQFIDSKNEQNQSNLYVEIQDETGNIIVKLQRQFQFELIRVDLPIECNYKLNSKIIIKITDQYNRIIIDKSIKEGDISGYTGYMENLGDQFGILRLKWTIRTDLLLGWPCNPNRFIPQLLMVLLKNESMYFYFFEPVFNALSSNDKIIVLKSLPWLRLIKGDRCHIRQLAKIFMVCCHDQTKSDSPHLDLMIENSKIFFPSLTIEQQINTFRYFGQKFEKYLIGKSKSLPIKDHQQLINLVFLLQKFVSTEKKKRNKPTNSNLKDVYELIELMRQIMTDKKIDKNVRNFSSYLISFFDEKN